ncbi:MAG: hypothetical protein R2865_16150 [Deinococcales bacterium]
MGGVGKTHLSLSIAHLALSKGMFRQGVYFLGLEQLSSRLDILSSLADILNLQLRSQDDALKQICQGAFSSKRSCSF